MLMLDVKRTLFDVTDDKSCEIVHFMSDLYALTFIPHYENVSIDLIKKRDVRSINLSLKSFNELKVMLRPNFFTVMS